jgi:hypothetical protein
MKTMINEDEGVRVIGKAKAVFFMNEDPQISIEITPEKMSGAFWEHLKKRTYNFKKSTLRISGRRAEILHIEIECFT